ncbi:uncharacterized protein LOC102808575 [Saccoglossus kowalevskii]|uniref:Uncharacterized protein LOC102808575 n=1 Tax=Saccoglossus kowalevskii TaxID=10224 RepID=A0ABM0MK23_SACKO|nr:PREDICTED: uncharacterized protein LOC102808575 [Saccoglossus kowalevskii]
MEFLRKLFGGNAKGASTATASAVVNQNTEEDEFTILSMEDVGPQLRTGSPRDTGHGTNSGSTVVESAQRHARGIARTARALLPSRSKPIQISYHTEDTREPPNLHIFIENFDFFIHADMLLKKSGYMRALLASGMADSDAMKTSNEMRFNAAPPTARAMLVILDHIYDKETDIPEDEELQDDVMMAADFLEVSLNPKLFSKFVTLESWAQYLTKAKLHNWANFTDFINLFLAAHYRYLRKGEQLSNLSASAIRDIEHKTECDEIREFSKTSLCILLKHEAVGDDHNVGKVLCCYDDAVKDWILLDVFPPRCNEFNNSLHSSFRHTYVALKIGHYRRDHNYDSNDWREMQIVTNSAWGLMKLVSESFTYDAFTGKWKDISHMTPPGLSKGDMLFAQSESIMYAIPPYTTKHRGLIVYNYQPHSDIPVRWRRHVFPCPCFTDDMLPTEVRLVNACLFQNSLYVLCSDRHLTDTDDNLFIAEITPTASSELSVNFVVVNLNTAVDRHYVRLFSNRENLILLFTSSDDPTLLPITNFLVFTLHELCRDTASFKAVTKVSATQIGIRSLPEFLRKCKIALVGNNLYFLSAIAKEDIFSFNVLSGISCLIAPPQCVFDPWKDVVAFLPLGVPIELHNCATKIRDVKIYVIRDDL